MEPSPSGAVEVDMSLDDVNQAVKRKQARLLGPVKWCKRCSRKHPSRAACQTYIRTENTRSGALRNVETTVPPPGLED
jgi:hypothetical protein